jgi:outer membrane biosynthesis protein TonB
MRLGLPVALCALLLGAAVAVPLAPVRATTYHAPWIGSDPTEEPTPEPTEAPTPEATEAPTPEATEAPTPEATEAPTAEPSPPAEETPRPEPSAEPTAEPTPEPTVRPTPEATPMDTSGPPMFQQSGSSHTESSSESTTFSVGTPSPGPTPTASPKPTPTPNPWRAITVATTSLAPANEGSIQILNTFAAARRDGTAAAACVSFKNTDSRTATRVLFAFTLVDGNGGNVGTFTLDRRGTFSPGIDINGYSGLSDWASGGGNRGYADNCTTLSRNMAALPILSARFATYSVQRVEYADGTSWNATGSSQPH